MKHLALVLLAALFSSTATAGPPVESGVVARGTTTVFHIFVDQNAGLLAVLGGDPVGLCNGSNDLDFVAWQDMNMPNGLRWATINIGSNIRTTVYDLSDFDGYDDLCVALWSGVLPLATGEVNYRMQDNDYAGSVNCELKSNINSYGHSFAGPLYSLDGTRRQFSGRDRFVWDCDNLKFLHYDVKLSLTR